MQWLFGPIFFLVFLNLHISYHLKHINVSWACSAVYGRLKSIRARRRDGKTEELTGVWWMVDGGWETNAHSYPSQSVQRSAERELPIVDIAGQSLTEGHKMAKRLVGLGLRLCPSNDSHVALSYAQISR